MNILFLNATLIKRGSFEVPEFHAGGLFHDPGQVEKQTLQTSPFGVMFSRSSGRPGFPTTVPCLCDSERHWLRFKPFLNGSLQNDLCFETKISKSWDRQVWWA